MPARNKTAGGGGSGSSRASVSSSPRSDGDDMVKDNDAYKLKRKRNNDAVKKTREKSKQTALERKGNVEKLREQNSKMEAQIEEVKEHVETLKNILLQKIDSEERDQLIKDILQEDSNGD